MTFASTREISRQVSFHPRHLNIFTLSQPLISRQRSRSSISCNRPGLRSFLASLSPPRTVWDAQGSGRCLPCAGCCERGRVRQRRSWTVSAHEHKPARAARPPRDATERREGKKQEGLISFSVCLHRPVSLPRECISVVVGVRKSACARWVEVWNGWTADERTFTVHPSRRTLSCSPACPPAACLPPCLPAHSLACSRPAIDQTQISHTYPASQP